MTPRQYMLLKEHVRSLVSKRVYDILNEDKKKQDIKNYIEKIVKKEVKKVIEKYTDDFENDGKYNDEKKSENTKKRPRIYDKVENKKGVIKRNRNYDRNESEAQTILKKKGVNMAEIARHCPSVSDMSDDGRRSLFAKFKNNKLVPDSKLNAEIYDAYQNFC